MKIGYIRISTADQNIARQEVLMHELGVENMFIDRMSGKEHKPPRTAKNVKFCPRGRHRYCGIHKPFCA